MQQSTEYRPMVKSMENRSYPDLDTPGVAERVNRMYNVYAMEKSVKHIRWGREGVISQIILHSIKHSSIFLTSNSTPKPDVYMTMSSIFILI